MTTTLTTPEELRELAKTRLTVSVPVAGRFLGLGQALSYELVQRGEFPVPVLRLGRKLRVPTAALLATLGLPAVDDGPDAA